MTAGLMVTDRLISVFDKLLRTSFAGASSLRAVPGLTIAEFPLSVDERFHSAALMRVNHVGEVCAQALYHGQALTCSSPEVCEVLRQAAREETEHLAWTEGRIYELGGRKSLLNPLWYVGALAMGAVAGKLGDAWSLGFLAETERQVEQHLDNHLYELPRGDLKSRAIVQQMKADEGAHAATAVSLGARNLPYPAVAAMRLASRVMTRTAYYL